MDSRTRLQFEFIEMLLAYEGEITNQRLREKFGVTSVQASRVLASYRDAFPSNTQTLKGQGRGRYVPTARFKPEIANLSIEAYFRSVKDQVAHVRVEETQRDFTNVDPALFRVIHSSMDQGAASRIIYRSMNNPDGIERIIHPLAFVFAGRRWHVRGFDELTEQHRDFNLARISCAESAPKSVETPTDINWEEKVQLELRPHPSLTEGQEKLIRDELFKGAIGRRITTRRALIRYVLRDLEVAENPEVQHPPEFQIYLFRAESLQGDG
ncbi:WYL domain-containing protein [Shewanella algae]|uniref:WYL domain-containing protein n=1 Tax=Shewanella algae TaxID=38313 RepID=UPI001AAEC5A1|nr:WYL domain-containing protein [Shewanella algae]MBO2694267.1 WYL domain-containing protein [Shewanella algae]